MQKQPENLNPIEQINSGARVPAMRLVRDNPKAAAMVSKLVVDHRAPIKQDILQEQGAGINTANLRAVAHEGMQNVNDNETVAQLLSDTELAAQILTSVILSPKDMMGVEVGYKSDLTHWTIPHEVNSSMTNAVRNYFEEVYKIKPRLSTMLDHALFKRGCYPVAVLPENAIDDLIHGNGSITTESFKSVLAQDGQMRSLGLLGPVDSEREDRAAAGTYRGNIGLALEHLITHQPNKTWTNSISIKYESKDKKEEIFNTGITVTDNLHVLKIPALSQKLRAHKTREVVTGRKTLLSVESISRRINNTANPPTVLTASNTVQGNIFHQSRLSQTVIKEIKTQDKLKRRSVGMPLEVHFPSEAVIPVHVPNQPAKQIGFFVLLDLEGNPINRGQGINHYRELGLNLQQNSFASSMIQRAGLALSDNSDILSRGQGGLTMGRMYGQMLERDLMQRLKNGLVGGSLSIAGNDEIYRLMLARSLANQQTQILYIPAEYMTYIAFDYHTNGTGKSLLDNTRIIDSMSAMLMVGGVMGALRNSIGRTHVDLELDPEAPDPWKVIEQTMSEIINVNGNGFPLGTINPLDIKDSLIRSQFEFGFSGHPRVPNMKVDFTEKNTNYQPPDPKISDDLRKRRLMAFYLTPDQVDAAAGADFATSVANNSTLLSKRAMGLQQEFTPQVSAHLRKHAINSADLVQELVEIVDGSYSEILKEFKDDDQIEMFDGTKVTKEELDKDPIVKAQFIRELIEDFIGGFSMTLPEPDTTKANNLAELYEKQSQLVENALKDWISEDQMDKAIVGEEMANHMRVVFLQLKSYFMRKWQVKNGLMSELSELTAVGDDGEVEIDIPEIQATHNAAIIEIATKLLTANKKVKEKATADLKKAGVAESDSYGSSDSSTDTSSGMDGGFGGSGSGSDMGLGGDFDFSLDDGGSGGDAGTSDTSTNVDTVDLGLNDATTDEPTQNDSSTTEPASNDENDSPSGYRDYSQPEQGDKDDNSNNDGKDGQSSDNPQEPERVSNTPHPEDQDKLTSAKADTSEEEEDEQSNSDANAKKDDDKV